MFLLNLTSCFKKSNVWFLIRKEHSLFPRLKFDNCFIQESVSLWEKYSFLETKTKVVPLKVVNYITQRSVRVMQDFCRVIIEEEVCMNIKICILTVKRTTYIENIYNSQANLYLWRMRVLFEFIFNLLCTKYFYYCIDLALYQELLKKTIFKKNCGFMARVTDVIGG